MVLGHWLEMRAISQARGALNALAALLPDTAERVSGAEVQTVPISEQHVGDVVLVRPGTRVPADGTVLDGSADVDEPMITGESKGVSKEPGALDLFQICRLGRPPAASFFDRLMQKVIDRISQPHPQHEWIAHAGDGTRGFRRMFK